MARALNKLTAEATEAISGPGRHPDGGNLYLAISADGRHGVGLSSTHGTARSARGTGLGVASAGGVSLEEAREKAAEGRALVRAEYQSRLPNGAGRPRGEMMIHNHRLAKQ